ncbi:MAG: SDR family oxidoreductase [Leptospiraceae bacterium]|nr:SDR family oxidoreductase [Leptospiraceae bacterium]
MDSQSKRVALITGASTGIGYDLAKIFAKEKWDLVLVARNKSKLEEVSKEIENEFKVTVNIFPADLSLNESVEELYHFTKDRNLFVEVLVNNAGFGKAGEFISNSLEDELGMIDLNIRSLVHLTKLYTRDMIANKKGKILNVASTASFQPGPFMSNYYATKSYVLHFSEGLYEELKPKGITVTTLCPGPTRTEFQARAEMGNEKLVKGFLAMDSYPVALLGYKGLMSGKPIVIAGFINSMMATSIRFTPRFMVRKLLGYVNRKAK